MSTVSYGSQPVATHLNGGGFLKCGIWELEVVAPRLESTDLNDSTIFVCQIAFRDLPFMKENGNAFAGRMPSYSKGNHRIRGHEVKKEEMKHVYFTFMCQCYISDSLYKSTPRVMHENLEICCNAWSKTYIPSELSLLFALRQRRTVWSAFKCSGSCTLPKRVLGLLNNLLHWEIRFCVCVCGGGIQIFSTGHFSEWPRIMSEVA